MLRPRKTTAHAHLTQNLYGVPDAQRRNQEDLHPIRTGLDERGTSYDRRERNDGPPPGIAERRSAGSDRRQDRAYGRPFELFKLRTMVVDAEAGGARWATRNDPRVTAVGRVLRRSRLDEFPQLLNVLRGEMSLVGPRPERPEFIERLHHRVPGYLDRLGVKPGVTGLAQVLNGYDTSLDSVQRKVCYDLTYLQNYSLWNDIKILVRTVAVVLTGKGAH